MNQDNSNVQSDESAASCGAVGGNLTPEQAAEIEQIKEILDGAEATADESADVGEGAVSTDTDAAATDDGDEGDEEAEDPCADDAAPCGV